VGKRPYINCLQSNKCSASCVLTGPDSGPNRELLLGDINNPGEGQRLGNGTQDKSKSHPASSLGNSSHRTGESIGFQLGQAEDTLPDVTGVSYASF
jgi:hypothetical protein